MRFREYNFCDMLDALWGFFSLLRAGLCLSGPSSLTLHIFV